MPNKPFSKPKPVSLKAHPEYNERWLQQLIAEDPSLLGLGDEIEVRDVERRQPRAGRLDLLLSDASTNTRYEVEIQLGATDESHIIRTIEYWDLEKNRYPLYDHVAVIVAEDVTSRFLNVISLLNRAVPLIAIQMNAWEVGDSTTITATKVLDLVPAAPDDEDTEPGHTVDRNYWTQQASAANLKTVDNMLALIREATGDDRLALKYNKHYIGLARDGIADNFITMRPRKSQAHVWAAVRVPRSDELKARMEDAGLDVRRYETRWGNYQIAFTAHDLTANRALLIDLIQRASGLKADTPELQSDTPTE